ncbi:uncharacterized protein MONBRDRAFT_28396 [Monosiga brevicollis MX1]|uniref:Tyrosine specific protein phosphatases domain-containing protein n=1 Tax=Monosiga brevicollis TaxID=81824 RepID=A9V821_MONBE|nr:uncharacterized protein MONBRDRAFT_28396 [Monosiga brevicollis MX1]EDQ86263.1 predicted protein [Monosiga brevicollis MX1]|eukprot:XP_001748933.1 hypothetical protein [Monosiga brevicollis MX1]
MSAAMQLVGVVAVTVAVAGWLAPVAEASYDADQNKSSTNFLFRGNLPVTDNHTFAKEALVARMQQLAAEQNLTFPETFYFVDLSLLDPFEVADAEVEIKYFKEHPNEGEYINWLTVGDVVHPEELPVEARLALARNLSHWQMDKLPQRMGAIDALLNSTTVHGPIVAYIHCEAGMDRTGEMSGSYYMHALNWTFHQALAYDDSIETRNISIYSQNAFQWYCYFLSVTYQPWQDCSLP